LLVRRKRNRISNIILYSITLDENTNIEISKPSINVANDSKTKMANDVKIGQDGENAFDYVNIGRETNFINHILLVKG
jgi:hypothetical protein